MATPYHGQYHACPLIRRKKEHRDLTSSATVAGAGSGLGGLVFGLAPGRVANRLGVWKQYLQQHPRLVQYQSTPTSPTFLPRKPILHSQSQPPPHGARNAAGGRPPPDRIAGGRAGVPPARTGPHASGGGRAGTLPLKPRLLSVHPQGRTPRLPDRETGRTSIRRLRMAYWNSKPHPALPHQNRRNRHACA